MATDFSRISNLAVPPGSHLEEEIEAREMSLDELAAGLGMPVAAVKEIIGGDRAITPKTAAALENFLGITAALWLNLEAGYRVTLARNFETYGHANPFEGPEPEWPDIRPEMAV